MQAIVAAVGDKLDRNPREIKRFVNVFRFYVFIRQERNPDGLRTPETLIQVAKLAVLTIRWPQMRGLLGRHGRVGISGVTSVGSVAGLGAAAGGMTTS